MKFFTVRKCLSMLFVLSFGLVLFDVSPFVQTAEANNYNYQRRTPPKPKPREYDKIVSVDATANKVTIYDHVSKSEVVYKVNKFTKVTLDGKASELSQLQKGMNVEVTSSAGIASKLDANTKTAPKA